MKRKLGKFLLFVYLNHIKEDWDEFNLVGKIVLYPFWVIRSILVWAILPFWVFDYFDKTDKDWIKFKSEFKTVLQKEFKKMKMPL